MKINITTFHQKRLADAILWASGLKYYTHDDKRYEGSKIFSFEDTEYFREVLTALTSIQKQYKNSK